jgi:hypothetical protein
LKTHYIVIIWLTVIVSSSVFAQRGSLFDHKERVERNNIYDSITNIIDSVKSTLPSLEIELNSSNKAVFWGRTFGLNQYSMEPSLLFNTGKGLFLYNSNYFWSEDASPNIIAKSDFGIGYERDLTERLSASVSYERWLYYNGDTYVKHAIQNSAEAQVFYDFDFVNLETAVYYMFGNVNILETDVNISQEFFLLSFSKHSALYLFPEVTSIFANKNFLPIYSDFPSNFNNNNQFRLIDLELNIPLRLQLKNIEIEPNFHYNVPIQQVNEIVKPFGYFSLRLSYNLHFDKHKQIK